MNLSLSQLTSLHSNFTYNWQETSLKYLGIHPTPLESSFFSNNYHKLFAEIQKLLNKWNSFPISLFGRISAVKMTILPRLMYQIETLPIPNARRDLKSLQASIFHFIRVKKRHSIVRKSLISSKVSSSLAVPDILKYYCSAQLRKILAWSSLFTSTKLMEIEQLGVAPIHPNSLLWSTSQVKNYTPLLGPMQLTRDVWKVNLWEEI